MSQTVTDSLACWIYRSSKKDEMYLYLAKEDSFSELPEALQKGFGRPEFVMELTLSPQRPLAREDVNKVITGLREEGFFLQMPPKLTPELHEGEQTF